MKESAIKKQLLALLLISTNIYPSAVDYNGNHIIKRGGSITITPQTSSAVLASYTQSISFNGLVDNTFGQLGIVAGVAPTTLVHAVFLQSDGKIVAVGVGNNRFCVARYNSDGSVDSSFNGGVAVTGPATTVGANGGVLQPDGKIVAVGKSSTNTFCVARYNTDGSVDTSFNGGNPVITAGTFQANAAALQSDGKIIGVGQTTGGGGGFCVVRYNTDGLVDATFNGGVPISTAGTAIASAILIQTDGKIVVVGQNGTPRFCLVRYNTDGTVDATFNGGTPVVGANTTTFAVSALLQPDGKIVAAGQSTLNDGLGNHFFCITRYNSDGSVDTTFNGGIPAVGAATPPANANAILLQPDGKIVAVGASGAPNHFFLTRYNTDGSIDSTFNGGTPVIGTGIAGANTAVLQPDNKIIAAGASGGRFYLSRYINPFTLATFTASYGAVGLL